MADIEVGEKSTLTAKFRNSDGELQEPFGDVMFEVKDPEANVTGPDVVSATSVGVYKYSFTPSVSGTHLYRVTTGDGFKETSSFQVDEDDLQQ
jgi:hypothetical protein